MNKPNKLIVSTFSALSTGVKTITWTLEAPLQKDYLLKRLYCSALAYDSLSEPVQYDSMVLVLNQIVSTPIYSAVEAIITSSGPSDFINPNYLIFNSKQGFIDVNVEKNIQCRGISPSIGTSLSIRLDILKLSNFALTDTLQGSLIIEFEEVEPLNKFLLT